MGWIEELAQKLGRDANVAATVNVARGKGGSTSSHARQRIVQRDGETTVHSESDVHHEGTPHDREA